MTASRKAGKRKQGGGRRKPPRKATQIAENHWIYGRHAVDAALGNEARRHHRLVVTRDGEAALENLTHARDIRPEIVSSGEIDALLPPGAVHQGVALLADPLPQAAIEDVIERLKDDGNAVVIVLDQVTDPRNVGAIMRSAAAFGAGAVILPERRGAGTGATLAKAASGAVETVMLAQVTNIARAMEALKKAEFWCIGLDAGADAPIQDVDLKGRLALVMGSEGRGLRRLVAETCDILTRLPINADMESLNVSAAAAIALYEAARRRN